MTQTSIGFNGTVNDKQWARLARTAYSPCIERPGDLPITQVSGARGIKLGVNPNDAAGAARSAIGGDGILTTLDAEEVVSIPAPSTNGQWFLVVLNRVWATSTTQFLVRNGATTAATFGFLPPTSFPATFRSDPGTNSDVAVAWVWAQAASNNVYWFPLLGLPEDLYPLAGPSTLRSTTLGGYNSNAPAPWNAYWLQTILPQWYDTTLALLSTYQGQYDATNNQNGVQGAAGWYPVSDLANPLRYSSEAGLKSGNSMAQIGDGQLGYARDTQGLYYRRTDGRTVRLDGAGSFIIVAGSGSVATGTTLGTMGGSSTTQSSSDTAVFPVRTDGVIGPLPVAGWYEVTGSISWQSTSNGERYLSITQNDTELNPPIADRTTAAGASPVNAADMIYLNVGDFIKLKAWQNSGSTLTYTSRLTAKLLRPANP